MRRRRYLDNKAGIAAQARILEDLPDKLERRGLLRMQLMYPPPLGPKQLLRMLYEPDELAAMHLLVKRNLVDIMETEDKLVVNMEVGGEGHNFQVSIPYPGSLPVARTRVSVGKTYSGMHLGEMIRTPHTDLMVKWMNDIWSEREIIRHLKGRLRVIRENCSTIGQALRVWPDIHHLLLLTDGYREYVREAPEAKARSPIPMQFFIANSDDEIIEPRVLEPEWQPEKLAQWGAYLASLHMLPEKPARMVEFTMYL